MKHFRTVYYIKKTQSLRRLQKKEPELYIVATATVCTNMMEQPGAAWRRSQGCHLYLPKVLDEDLNYYVLELDVHHRCHSVLLCSHEGRSKYHSHVRRWHQILSAVLTYAVERREKRNRFWFGLFFSKQILFQAMEKDAVRISHSIFFILFQHNLFPNPTRDKTCL